MELGVSAHTHLTKSPYIDSFMKHGRNSALYIYNLWKGRRKEKDVTSPVQEEYKLYMEERYVRDCVTDYSDLQHLINLPPGLSYDEWLATHTISFFEHINLMYGIVSEFCTPVSCTAMTAPCSTQYYWFDEKGKKSKYAAPQYIDYVMTYIQKTIADESVFPTKYGQDFPPMFDTHVKKIHRFLFHVVAHIYYAHFKDLVTLGLQAHINILMKHFMLFNELFSLLEYKDSEILDDLTSQLLCKTPATTPCSPTTDTISSISSDDKENCRHVENKEVTFRS